MIYELFRCRSSHDVKRIATKWVPTRNQSWTDIRFIIMEDICRAKLKQCRAFKNALRQSNKKILVHNTETDPVWGCGHDFRGANGMGQILMNVRTLDLQYQKDFPSLPPPAAPTCAPPSDNKKMPPPSVLVIGNSNVRGISEGLNERGLDGTAFVYPGQTTSQIRRRTDNIVKATKSKPKAILIHSADIEIRDFTTCVSKIVNDVKALVTDLHERCEDSRIILSSLPLVPHKRHLNDRIGEYNNAISSLCRETSHLVYLCNKTAKLRHDGIHLTRQSKDLIARTTARHVKQCV